MVVYEKHPNSSRFFATRIKCCAHRLFIAEKNDATIHLIHVVKSPEDWEILSNTQQDQNPEIQHRISEAEIQIGKFADYPIFKSVHVIPRVFGGVPYKTILGYALDYKIDLIVMGTHGKGEAPLLFIGSTTQKIIRDASCPVLSVKKNFKPVSMNRILYVSDFSETGIKNSIRLVSDFADSIKSKIDFAFINTPADFTDTDTIEKRLKALQGAINPKKHKLFIHNDFYTDKGILNISKKIKTNVVALATHNRRFRKNYQIGVTETLLYQSDMPILSVVI